METETIIIVSVFSAAWLVLLIISIVLCTQVASLRRKVQDLGASGRLRIQKLTMSSDKNHAFNNPTLAPDEELARRGYSMYQGSEADVESSRGTERQTGGQFVEELAREIDYRQQQQKQQRQQQQQYPPPHPQGQQQKPTAAPPFLLQSIESSQHIKALANPVASNGRQSETNPNFIY